MYNRIFAALAIGGALSLSPWVNGAIAADLDPPGGYLPRYDSGATGALAGSGLDISEVAIRGGVARASIEDLRRITAACIRIADEPRRYDPARRSACQRIARALEAR